MRENLFAAAREALISDGWTFDRIVTAAYLPVQTAAGGRQAVASLRIPGSVYWEYWSEGRNVLSTHTTFVPDDATPEQVRELVTAALWQVREKIDDSYARRLYLNDASKNA